MRTLVAAGVIGLVVGGIAGAVLRPAGPDRCQQERQRAAAALAAQDPSRKVETVAEQPLTPELGPTWQEAQVKGQLQGVVSRTGAELVQLDCSQLPCLAALRFTDSESVRQAPGAINLAFTEPVLSAFVLAHFPPAGETENVPWMFLALAPADLEERYLNHMRERMRVFRDDVKRSEGAE